MKDIGLKFEYGYFYSFSIKNDKVKQQDTFFGASVWLKYYCVLLTVVKSRNQYLLNALLFLFLLKVIS